MKNQKESILIIVLLSIAVLSIVLILTLTGILNFNNNINDDSIDNIEITNSEVKQLYNYVQASLNTNSVCL